MSGKCQLRSRTGFSDLAFLLATRFSVRFSRFSSFSDKKENSSGRSSNVAFADADSVDSAADTDSVDPESESDLVIPGPETASGISSAGFNTPAFGAAFFRLINKRHTKTDTAVIPAKSRINIRFRGPLPSTGAK